ncbi:Pentatricopeptide repeat-containing protein MRL1 [Durusdinium trenchii]|uniref:Chloroplastic (Protein MATURATION OF RBCL 1) (AtMRL1) n=1 Tax=Durusdinium trenchii TaxID=1381693 RepID=A0ABP0PY97_9DINO
MCHVEDADGHQKHARSITGRIARLGRAGRWQQALQTLRRYQELQDVDVQMYGALLGALSRVGLWEQALGIMQELEERELQPNAVACGALLRSCKQQGRWQEALQLLATFKAKVPLTLRLSSELINVCAQASQWQTACAALAQLQSQGLDADAVAFNSAIAACARGFAWAAALKVLEEIGEPDEVSFTAVINACEKGHEWALALKIFDSMSSGSLMSRMSRNAAISACEKGSAWKEALLLLDLGSADVVGFSAAMSACARATHWQEALELLTSLEKKELQPDLVAYSTGVFACEQAACWQGALELLCPDPVAYTSCIGASAFAQKWEIAAHLWGQLQEHPRLKPTAMSYAAVAFAHGTARRWQQVLELQVQVRKLGWLPSGMYSAVVRGLGGAFQWEKALALLPEMHHVGPAPDTVVYGSLLAECARSWQWSHVLVLLDAMTRSWTMPDAVAYSLLLSTCSRAQHYSKALPFLRPRRLELSKRHTGHLQKGHFQHSLRLAAAAAMAAHSVAVRANAAGWRMLGDIAQLAQLPEWQQRSQDAEPLSSLESRSCVEEASWRRTSDREKKWSIQKLLESVGVFGNDWTVLN